MINLEELIWKCQDCDASAPPTAPDYMKIIKHAKGHHIRLVNINTGEILATTVKEAHLKGIDIPVKVEKQEEKVLKSTEGGKLATVVAKQPAPVIFVLGDQRIELEPEALYESYLLYQDMKVRCGLDSTFSGVMRDGVALLWRVIASEPIVESGTVKMEVKYGGRPGLGEKEVGVGS